MIYLYIICYAGVMYWLGWSTGVMHFKRNMRRENRRPSRRIGGWTVEPITPPPDSDK